MTLLDTFQSVRKLRDNGASEPLAEAIVEVAQDAAEAATDDLATKSDLKSEVAEVKSDIAQLRAENRAALAELKSEIFRAMWFFGIGIITVNLTAIGIATGIIIAVN